MKVEKQEVARWVCFCVYVFLSILLWTTGVMIKHVPIATVIFILLAFFLLLGFKLIEKIGKSH